MDRRMPPLPSKEELAEVRKVSRAVKAQDAKNFITSNAVENILAVPRKQPEPIDWMKKPHFGEIPPYLVQVKEEIARETEYIKAVQQQQAMDSGIPPGMKVMPDEERQELIVALKTKWGEVNKLYQSVRCCCPS